jgi:hypothetical protein
MPWKPSEAGPCECGWFDRASAEPRVPIEFNQTVGEFHLRYEGCDGPSTLVFYYCPFCGGRAPPSRRDTLFAQPTDEELARLSISPQRSARLTTRYGYWERPRLTFQRGTERAIPSLPPARLCSRDSAISSTKSCRRPPKYG